MFLGTDYAFTYVNISIFTLFSLMELKNSAERTGLILLAIGLLTYLVQLIILNISNETVWLKHRTQFVILLRTIRVIISAFGVPYWIKASGEDWPTLYRTLLVGSGAMINVWMALGSPLIFKFHFYLHLPLVLLMWFTTGWKTCDQIMGNNRAAIKLSLLKQNVESVINGLITPSTHGSFIPEDRGGVEECRQLVTLIYLIMSLAAPSFVLWTLEIHSRASFAKNLHNSRDPELRSIKIDCSRVPQSSTVFIALLMSLLILWTLL
eukprot:g5877.t1